MSNPKFSKREKEVTKFLLEGKSNKQIAHKLGVSVRTVEFHLSNIYARLNTRSRTEAVIKLTELNLRKPAGKNTGKVLRKSTVTKKGQFVENGGNQIQRRFPMKNLLLGIVTGVMLTLIIIFTVSYVNTHGGPAIVMGRVTPTLVPFETPTLVPFEMTATPTALIMEETSTPFPMTLEPASTPIPTKQP
jgi:DNA-binding CsgD family transcriptional regulator